MKIPLIIIIGLTLMFNIRCDHHKNTSLGFYKYQNECKLLHLKKDSLKKKEGDEEYTKWLMDNIDSVLLKKSNNDLHCNCFLYELSLNHGFGDFNSIIDDDIITYLAKKDENKMVLYKILCARSTTNRSSLTLIKYETYRKKILATAEVQEVQKYYTDLLKKCNYKNTSKYLNDYLYQALLIIYQSDMKDLQYKKQGIQENQTLLHYQLSEWRDSIEN